MKYYTLTLFAVSFLVCSSAQNVGIGTATPAAKLEIRHSSSLSNPTLLLYDSIATEFARLKFMNASGNKYWDISGKIDNNNDALSKLNFYHSIAGDILSINGNGKVGIGTLVPQTSLHVFVPAIGYGITHEANGTRLATYIDGGGAYFGTRDNAPLHFFTNDGLAQMTITTNGNTGIGNTFPQYKLDIGGRMRIKTGSVGNAFTSSGTWMEDYRDGSNRIFLGMQDSIRLGIWGEGVPGAGWAFNFNARNGNVGIGVASAAEKLEVGGNVKANNFLLNAPKTYYYSLSGADFTALLSEHATRNEYNAGGGVYMAVAQTEGLVAPVHLPHGSTITSFIVHFIDTDGTINLNVELKPNFTGGVMASITSSGAPGQSFLTDNTIVNPLVDNLNNSYIITAKPINGNWAGNFLVLQRVVIEYTLDDL